MATWAHHASWCPAIAGAGSGEGASRQRGVGRASLTVRISQGGGRMCRPPPLPPPPLGQQSIGCMMHDLESELERAARLLQTPLLVQLSVYTWRERGSVATGFPAKESLSSAATTPACSILVIRRPRCLCCGLCAPTGCKELCNYGL